MGKFHIHTQILQGDALFSGKIYTVGNIFKQSPVVTVTINFKSALHRHPFTIIVINKTITTTTTIIINILIMSAELRSV